MLVACAPLEPDAGLGEVAGGKGDGIPADFDANLIVEEWLFTDTDSLSIEHVQRFLEDVPHGRVHPRRSWLADATVEDPVTGIRRPFSEVIVTAARMVDLNPLMLLVRMQVEKSTINSTNPPSERILSCAFGCDCDCRENATCNRYASFARQVACVISTHRRRHDESMDERGAWQAGQPRVTNDGLTITPRNHATAALYAYTPWVLDPATAQRRGMEPGGNFLVWQVTRQYYNHFVNALGVDFGQGARRTDTGTETTKPEWERTTGSAFIGDPCVRHSDCDYPNGFCHPLGLCSMRCSALCPEASDLGLSSEGRADTFCVARPDAVTTYGMCVPKAGPENAYCDGLPRTTRADVYRWLGERTDVEETDADVCYPFDQSAL